jgi:hypothetical protein
MYSVTLTPPKVTNSAPQISSEPLQTQHQFQLLTQILPSAPFITPISDFSCFPRRFSRRRSQISPYLRRSLQNPVAASGLSGKNRPPRRRMHASQPLDSISNQEIDAEKTTKRGARAEHEKPLCTNNN